MKRQSRVELYRELCKRAGMVPRSSVGYLSRKEMMELLFWLTKKEQSTEDGKGAPCQPKEKTE